MEVVTTEAHWCLSRLLPPHTALCWLYVVAPTLQATSLNHSRSTSSPIINHYHSGDRVCCNSTANCNPAVRELTALRQQAPKPALNLERASMPHSAPGSCSEAERPMQAQQHTVPLTPSQACTVGSLLAAGPFCLAVGTAAVILNAAPSPTAKGGHLHLCNNSSSLTGPCSRHSSYYCYYHSQSSSHFGSLVGTCSGHSSTARSEPVEVTPKRLLVQLSLLWLLD